MLAETAEGVTSGLRTLWSVGVGVFGAQTIEPEDFSPGGAGRDVDPILGAWGIEEYELDPFLDMSRLKIFEYSMTHS